jgi:hypothetical protein
MKNTFTLELNEKSLEALRCAVAIASITRQYNNIPNFERELEELLFILSIKSEDNTNKLT